MMLPFRCDELRRSLPALLCCEVCHAQDIGVVVRDRPGKVCCEVYRDLQEVRRVLKEEESES